MMVATKTSSEYRQPFNKIILSEGASSLSDKELLKYIFSFAAKPNLAQKYAKTLFSAYGSLNNILCASLQEILNLGIPESLAVLVKLAVHQYQVTAYEILQKERIYDTAEKIGSLFINLYAGLPYEKLYMLMLNEKCEFIGLVPLFDGAVNNVQIQDRPIIETAIRNHASIVVLAHNHPYGTCEPSDMDTNTTCNLHSMFAKFGITLAEHFVIADNQWSPVIALTSRVPNYFPDSFYGYYWMEYAKDLYNKIEFI